MSSSLKNALLRMVVVIAVWSCASPVGESGGPGVASEAAALTAGDYGLELTLPFPAGSRRQLTRAYMRDIADCNPPPGEPRRTSHCRYAVGLWDDSLALDFAGEGCDAWRAPVLAAAEGRVVIPLDPTGSRARSYGAAEVAIDHGNGCLSHYAHLDERTVADGQLVRQGDVIGYEGNAGNTQGAACAEHPGTHLHFKVVCDGSAVKPEPLSGFGGFDGTEHYWFGRPAVHHPVGTLVKTRDDPRVYQVCAPDRLCHVADERVWRSHRFFQDARDEWAAVVIVSDDEIACHDVGPPIASDVRIVATTCGSATFVTYDGEGSRWRRKVPFDTSQAGYRILLKSWGFRLDEVVHDEASCAIPSDVARPDLALRDGTVIEEVSEDGFFVISDDGTAYRMSRSLMPSLYGRSWPQVIQVPTGSVPLLVRSVSHAHPEFTVTDAVTCPNGRLAQEPDSGRAVGGGTDGDFGEPEVSATNPDPSGAAECPPSAGSGAPMPVVPEPTPIGPAGSITCTLNGTTVDVLLTGPVSGLVVGGTPGSPVAIKYGSDRYGWTDFGYGSDGTKDSAAWAGDYDASGEPKSYRFRIPSDAGRFNFYLYGSGGEVAWFDLPDADGDGDAWMVNGACRVVCDSVSCALSF